LARDIGAFVDEAGKEAATRRARLRQFIELLVDQLRTFMRQSCGVSEGSSGEGLPLPSDSETIADCLDRCLEALGQVEANANQATLLECWVDDLFEMLRVGRVC
jgi:DNA polymerase-3 subunit delta'